VPAVPKIQPFCNQMLHSAIYCKTSLFCLRTSKHCLQGALSQAKVHHEHTHSEHHIACVQTCMAIVATPPTSSNIPHRNDVCTVHWFYLLERYPRSRSYTA